MLSDTEYNDTQRGNVLFLILIAVVLFAALSYAVTQSSRTGGGDAGREANLIRSSELTQYPAAVKTAIVRMIINGVTYEGLKFNPPSAFGALASDELVEAVFHPSGGAAAYVQPSAAVMADNLPGEWFFNPNFEVDDIGTSTATSPDGNEFIAFLPGIKEAICDRLNEESNGVTTIPTASAIASTDVDELYDDGDSDTIPNETAIIGTSAGTTALAGQVAGCFEASDGVFVYYQVLAER